MLAFVAVAGIGGAGAVATDSTGFLDGPAATDLQTNETGANETGTNETGTNETTSSNETGTNETTSSNETGTNDTQTNESNAVDLRSIQVGETLAGEIDADDPSSSEYDGYYEPVSVNVTAGTSVRIDADSSVPWQDQAMYLVAPNGSVVAEGTAVSDDFSEDNFIRSHTFAQSGEYTIVVASEGSVTYNYTLSVTERRVPRDLRRATYGETVAGELDITDPSADRFNGHYEPVAMNVTANRTTRIEVDAGGNAYLYLVRPNGTIEARDEVFGNAVFPHYEFETTGEYTLAVGSWTDTTFNYTLTTRQVRDPTDLRSLEPGTDGSGEIDIDDPSADRFEGHYEPVAVTVSEPGYLDVGIDTDGSYELFVVAPNGSVLTTLEDQLFGGSDSVRTRLTQPGEYTVAVGSDGDEQFNYSLSVSELSQPWDIDAIGVGETKTSELEDSDPTETVLGPTQYLETVNLSVDNETRIDITAGTATDANLTVALGSQSGGLAAPDQLPSSPDPGNMSLRAVTLQAGVNYTISVIGGGEQSVPYRLSVAANATTLDPDSIELDETIRGQLDGDDPRGSYGISETVNFTAPRNTSVRITTDTQGHESDLIVLGGGRLVGWKWGNVDPTLKNASVTAGKTYEITVQSESKFEYNLTVEDLNGQDFDSIELGETTEDTLADNESTEANATFDPTTFTGTAGDVVDIEAGTTAEAGVNVLLGSPNDGVVALNISAGNASIRNYTLQASGQYRVIVWSYEPVDYTLSTNLRERTGNVTAGDNQTLFANDTDGDLLPDSYERNVTQTAPDDLDSDSSGTAADEGNDGVPDGAEDFDGDGLPSSVEYRLGTDPLVADTDGDGLSDGYESRVGGLSPTNNDSNGDGIEDGGDADGDGLDTPREVELGSDPWQADTDEDGLNDSAELDVGTNLSDPDTDDDGVLDGREIELGTDPLSADSDGDGTLDGNETMERRTTNENTGVSVAVSGEVSSVEPAEIQPVPSPENNSVTASSVVQIENQSEFKEATVRLQIDSSIAESEYGTLSVYKWNGSEKGRWHPVESTIQNGTAVATVESFSYFTVVDEDEWASADEVQTKTGPVSLDEANLTCSGACERTNATTVILGGEPTTQRITAKQGNETYEVVPLQNGQAIDEFYNYGNNEINSPIKLAESDTSQLFFWSGPEGLSLVVLHDKPDDGSGGAVDFGFSGLPFSDGEWVVRDDPPDFDRGSQTRPHWTWNDRRTDGGAFGGGLRDQSITITPYFNDAASEEPITPGSIDSWQLLWGQATDPRASQLDMDEPVTISVPSAPTESNGSDATTGDSGSATFDYDLARGQENLTLLYRTEQTDIDPSVTLEVTDAAGNSIRKSLRIGTRETYKASFNVSSLTGGEATITLAADGVDLRAQVLKGIGDIDNDGIPNYREDREWFIANYPIPTTFSTSATDSDTDGDGVPDGKEIESFAPRNSGPFALVNSNPEIPDSDFDGVDDATERQSYDYVRTTDDTGTRKVLRSGEDTTFEDLKGDAFKVDSTDTDPMRADSDGDTVSDLKERLWKTNARDADTDGDSIRDGNERSKGGDPTLYDIRPPKITVDYQESEFEWGLDDTYSVSFTVSDPSGVKWTALRENQENDLISKSSANSDTVEREDVTFKKRLIPKKKDCDAGKVVPGQEREGLLGDSARFVGDVISGTCAELRRGQDTVATNLDRAGDFTGNTVYVVAKDDQGHRSSSLAIERDGPVERCLEEAGPVFCTPVTTADIATLNTPLGTSVGDDLGTVRRAGHSSGMASSLGTTVTGLGELTDNPLQVVTGTARLANITARERLGVVQRLKNSTEQQLKRQQRLSNPYWDLGDGITQEERYKAYRDGWYSGYASGFVAKTAVGASATKAIKGTQTFSKVESGLASTRVGRALSRVDNVYDRGKARVGLIAVRASQRATGPIVRGARSAGDAFQRWRLRRQVDTDLSDLSEAQQQRVGQLLSREGSDGVAFVNKIDSDTLKSVLGNCGGAGSATLGLYAGVGPSVASAAGGTAVDCPDGWSDELVDTVSEQADNLPDEVDGLSDADMDTLTRMYVNLDQSRDGGLDRSEVNKLGTAFETADSVDVGPGSDPSEVVENLEYLSDRGIDDFVDAGGTDKTRYTGIAGESDIAKYLLEDTELTADDIDLNNKVKGIEGGPNGKTDYDVDVDPEGDAPKVTVNDEFTDSKSTLEEPALEAKHLDPASYDPDSFPKPQAEANGLEQKLVTQAADGEDELVVVTTREYMDAYGEDYLKPIRQRVKNQVDSDSDIKLDSDDLTIKFTTFGDLKK